ncbi:Hachiman antiphage defense system protein HamA [Leifsonia sp. EB34]|uniref:Hachiman antiphage defense system protein HamA n=1 Tax=Leifsonia sp. EB34 TaxID=3156303 RepID=UPI0035123320
MNKQGSRPGYLDHLTQADPALNTNEGVEIALWELANPIDLASLAEWARSFRQLYCLDDEIDELRSGTGKSRAEYLTDLVFPSASSGLGPATRAGDFTELLVSDYVEHELGLWVPRQKYMHKSNPDQSIQGVDVLGMSEVDPSAGSIDDVLLVCEVKAGLSTAPYADQLQKAIDDSSKDYLRVAYTLNATKRRLLAMGNRERAKMVERFQNIADNPYVLRSTAAAVLSDEAFDATALVAASTAGHNNKEHLNLLVVKGPELMKLVHSLYAEAASGA